MSEVESGKKSWFMCRCFLAGAFFAVACTVIIILLSSNTLNLAALLLPALIGGPLGIIVGRQVSRIQTLEQSHNRHSANLATFYQNTPAILHSMATDGTLLNVSQAWLDTLGYKREDVIGLDFFDLVEDDAPGTKKSEHLDLLKSLGEIKNTNYLLRKADDTLVEVSLDEVAQYDHKGSLISSLSVLSDLTGHRAAEERIERLAYYDTLTGLPNRTLMNDRILQSVAQARRENRQVGVFFFDLDRFKLINDTQGHAVGDLVLRSVAQRLKKFIREGDTFARLGGDEFVIIQADPNHDPNFTTMGKRILETLGLPFQIGTREFFTTASIGVAIYPIDGEDPQALLKSADTAMYVAKSRGRNNMQFFSEEMNSAALAKTTLESRLRKALSNGELQQHYQPQINLVTGKVIGVEALLRWYGSDGKLIPPSEIISVAEESGLVFPLGEWVLNTACAQAKKWQDAQLPQIRMSVNLSGHHIRQSNFIDIVESILDETGIKPNSLEIELAENSIMAHVNDSIMALTDLKVRGVNLAIDDFGTGYSSLLYLKHFPIHRIKIAQEFIRDIIHNPDYAAVTEAILLMAKSLNLSVTAVGVEEKMQLDFLKERGCVEVQGQLFGAAMNAEEITRFLTDARDKQMDFRTFEAKKDMTAEGSKEIH